MTLPPLWHCPECGRVFANRNQSHACGRHTLAHHFRGKPAEIRALFDRVVAVVRAIGPVRILPEKTRIAFQVPMSFAQITPRRHWLDGHVVLARLRAWFAEAYQVGEQRHLVRNRNAD
jgi:hypothetical protein